MTIPRPDFVSLWYQALDEPIGLLLWTDDPLQFKSQMAQARLSLADPRLADLQIRNSQFPEANLAIVHRRPTLPDSLPEDSFPEDDLLLEP